ncbi:MAG: HIT domain-containing protein [Propionibacteriaceae bacterium]|nr:HIT domain-containing protein [Propionibacteriaceae bacterium]
MSECLFCRIVAGEIPSKQVYADDRAYAFLDIEPWQEGHTLVIPRRHVDHALVDEDVLAELAPSVLAVSALLRTRLGATGFNILTNVGADSGQEVFHAHIHVLPRHADSPGIRNIRGAIHRDLDEVYALLTAE